MGYTGGRTPSPTYHDLGDHTESFQVEFDPRVISYRALLELFWSGHHPGRRGWSAQYKAALFFHDTAQQCIAEETRNALLERYGKVYTELLPHERFHLAEDYHQKYWLQNHTGLAREYATHFPRLADFVRSTATARVNGYLGGHGSARQLEQEIESLGLSAAGREALRKNAR